MRRWLKVLPESHASLVTFTKALGIEWAWLVVGEEEARHVLEWVKQSPGPLARIGPRKPGQRRASR